LFELQEFEIWMEECNAFAPGGGEPSRSENAAGSNLIENAIPAAERKASRSTFGDEIQPAMNKDGAQAGKRSILANITNVVGSRAVDSKTSVKPCQVEDDGVAAVTASLSTLAVTEVASSDPTMVPETPANPPEVVDSPAVGPDTSLPSHQKDEGEVEDSHVDAITTSLSTLTVEVAHPPAPLAPAAKARSARSAQSSRSTEEEDQIRRALRNFEIFNNWSPGTAELSKVRASSAGVAGWAEAALEASRGRPDALEEAQLLILGVPATTRASGPSSSSCAGPSSSAAGASDAVHGPSFTDLRLQVKCRDCGRQWQNSADAPHGGICSSCSGYIDEVELVAYKFVHGMDETSFLILRQLFAEEISCMPFADFMAKQDDISPRMRAILLDWLQEVNWKYKLRQETLCLTINIIDRYLSRVQVPRRKLQLLGVAAMFIASKFEEIYAPLIKDLVYITDSTYSREEILSMECDILNLLNFRILVPTVAHFFEHMQLANSCDVAQRELASYILMLGLIDTRMLVCLHRPSQLAAASLMLANNLLDRAVIWSPAMVEVSRYSAAELRPCASTLFEILQAPPGAATLQAARTRYSQAAHFSVALMTFDDIPTGRPLWRAE